MIRTPSARRPDGRLAAGALLLVLLAASPAAAQLNLIRTELAPGPGGLGPVEGAEVAPLLGLSFHLGLGVARRPIQLDRLVPSPLVVPSPVDWQGHGEVGVALGLPARLQLGLAVPFVFAETGQGADAGVRGGPGDIRVAVKWRALQLTSGGEDEDPATATRLFRLALKLVTSIPGGTRDRFLSDEDFTVAPGLLLEGRLGPISLYADLAVRLRSERVYLDVHQGHELRFGAGLAGQVHPQLDLGAVLVGGSTFMERATSPVEVLGVVRSRLGPVELTASAGGAVVDGVGAPAWRALLQLRYQGNWFSVGDDLPPPAEPWPLSGPALRSEGDIEPGAGTEIAPRPAGRAGAEPDRDGDGVPDRIDRCPDEPEDIDGFQDEDGCPDPDNDGDGVPDVQDACPNDPGPAWKQGCP